ncbi:MAG: hypothetical protein LUE92_11540 [Clostridiales bacterium]|nr:hypothetical protein [Clostridiales bacterium]
MAMAYGDISNKVERYVEERIKAGGAQTDSLAYSIYFRASEKGTVGTKELSDMVTVFEEALRDKICENPELQKDIVAAVYQLCEEHEKKAFFTGMKEGISLMTEL